MLDAPLNAPLMEAVIPGYPLLKRGKVRDMSDLGDQKILIVATDRISAFDVVMNEGVPGKGVDLTQMSNFAFRKFGKNIPNHLIETDFDKFPAELRQYEWLRGRSVIAHKAKEVVMIECVVREYLTGSGRKDYLANGEVCGICLKPGLLESEKLAEPIFTPATKAEEGHDENITFKEMARLIGDSLAMQLKRTSLEIFRRAARHALRHGLILADTKFEFGLDQSGRLTWLDEAITPDSSRIWELKGYQPGRVQPSYDKQFLRDYLESLGWNKQPPPPSLPQEVIDQTAKRYHTARRLLTDEILAD